MPPTQSMYSNPISLKSAKLYGAVQCIDSRLIGIKLVSYISCFSIPTFSRTLSDSDPPCHSICWQLHLLCHLPESVIISLIGLCCASQKSGILLPSIDPPKTWHRFPWMRQSMWRLLGHNNLSSIYNLDTPVRRPVTIPSFIMSIAHTLREEFVSRQSSSTNIHSNNIGGLTHIMHG